MKCIDCNCMTADCVCLLDGEEKGDLQEEKETCELLEDYKKDNKML